MEFGVYVHVPWCRHRCPYCSFTVYVERDPPFDAWIEGVKRDWRAVADRFAGEAHSVYFGGGTPSLAPADALAAVLAALPIAPGAEVTAEANPGTLSPGSLRAMQAAGINRLSLGIQTFNPDFAHLLSRGHTVGQARELLAWVADAGFRSWSVDVIFALPGQSVAALERDLDAILALQPPHVSLYGLTIKEGTPFARAEAQGRLILPDEDLWRAQYDLLVERLAAGGWERYEVSNFARPGHRARHNEAVWKGGYYAGLGPSAHGFLPDGSRTIAHPRWESWLAEPFAEIELPDPGQRAMDLVLTTLRHVDGLDVAALERAGWRLRPGAVSALAAGGLIERRGARLALGAAGWPLADGITLRLVEALEPHKPR